MKYQNLQRGQIVKIRYHDDVYGEEFATGMLISRLEIVDSSNATWKLYMLKDDGRLYKTGTVVSLYEFDLENRITSIE